MDTESIWTQRDPEPFLDENGELIPPSETVSVLSINFDSVTSNPDKSRADEIMLLTVKNKKQPPKSREKKPPGIGLPGGGVESKESLKHAADRESDGEAGYKLLKIYGEVFTDHRTHINNVVRIFLAEPSDLQTSIRESDEVDPNWKNWVSLREFFSMPYAVSREGVSINPDGVYFGHVRRVIAALNNILFAPAETLPKKVVDWSDDHFLPLISALNDLAEDGLIDVSVDGDHQKIEMVHRS